MSSVTLYRASGLALLLGAVLFIIGISLAFVSKTDTPPGLVMAGVWTSGLMLLLLGLPGIVAHQAARAGWLGFVGFLLTFSGAFLVVSYFAVVYLTIRPWFAVHAPKVGEQFLSTNPAMFLVGTFLSWGGLVLLGSATMRARVFSPWAGLLLIVAVVVDFFSTPGGIVGSIASPLSNVILVLGLGWMGYTLLTAKGEAKAVPQPVLVP
ncbi:MAG TPA: hypothetical protein VFQ36_25420 [Ktedonobacteraceae bacterium]|nr:hypothetical protein [Ktedonobacteraceae bacterium]